MLVVQANAATHNGLKAALDDLNNALTVDWYQTDRAFYSSQMEKFSYQVKSLKEQGLTNQELTDLALTQFKDEKAAKDLQTAFTIITIDKLSPKKA